MQSLSKPRCNEVSRYGKKEAGTGEHLPHFNNKINKHKWKAAAPHGRLPHTKHKLKFQAWSSLVFHCRHSFNPSEAPPWDSRPVSGAGVVHYQLLHRNYLAPFPRLSAPPHSSHPPFTAVIGQMAQSFVIGLPSTAPMTAMGGHYANVLLREVQP